MRTKTLSLVAALGAAGMMALQAQVYSVNVVGYVNVTVPAGKLALLCNPLDPGDANTIADLLTGLPVGTMVYKYDSATGGFVSSTYMGDPLGWMPSGDLTLNPGEGFFLSNPGPDDIQITFVGEVQQGTLEIPLVAGFNLVGSKVPQAGKVHTDLGLPVEDGDAVYTFNVDTQSYDMATYAGGMWLPTMQEPEVDVAEGFWVSKVNATTWTREFSVE